MVWIISIAISLFIGAKKGRPWSGIVWGLLLGPIGVLVLLCLKNLKKETEENNKQESENCKNTHGSEINETN